MLGLATAMAGAQTLALSRATIPELQAAMEEGILTAESLVRRYLARIAAYDQAGPALNTIICLAPDALEQARALDDERAARGPRGPLHGTVALVKDVFDTSDLPTTGGFAPMAGSQPARDAAVIERLRAAGVVVLGKLNLADWYGRTQGSGSSLTGPVVSPYNAGKYPGASSSGSGVAAAAWFSTFTLGSDTGGSLLIPAALNSVVALAPTQGLVSRRGMMWNSPRQERAGPMTRSVADAACVLDALAGLDAGDLITLRSAGQLPLRPYASFVDADGLRGMRLGVLQEMIRPGEVHAAGRELFAREVKVMRAAGAGVLDPVLTGIDLPSRQSAASTARYEQPFAADAYLSTLPPGVPFRSLAAMLAGAPDEVSPYLREAAALPTLDRYEPYLAAVQEQERLRAALIELMDREGLDALVLPYRTVTAPQADGTITGVSWREMRNGIHAYTGLPTILVPGGFFADGMPFSIQFIGRPFAEPTLIKIASGYEAVSQHRRWPPATPALAGESFSFAR